MDDPQIIEALDINGDAIVPGTVLRYINTDTVGRAVDIKEEDGGIWVLLDATDLYYNVEVLVITDPSALKEKKDEEKSDFNAREYAKRFESDDLTDDIGQITGGG
ncbi:DUF2098 domain-containing protein [Methanolobus sp. ZRKC3]|uniref:DUF2098 domain-containing protein n=1 Tax=Methanolobus sp. ZRKC3 TaxID=3125786 RepID=UPI0032466669